MFVLLV